MITKLTLQIDDQVIKSAKVFAKDHHISLSKLAENYCPFVECCGATLSELIEACGDRFHALKIYHEPEVECMAMPRTGRTERGKTPEEAVARLWLAVNKK